MKVSESGTGLLRGLNTTIPKHFNLILFLTPVIFFSCGGKESALSLDGSVVVKDSLTDESLSNILCSCFLKNYLHDTLEFKTCFKYEFEKNLIGVDGSNTEVVDRFGNNILNPDGERVLTFSDISCIRQMMRRPDRMIYLFSNSRINDEKGARHSISIIISNILDDQLKMAGVSPMEKVAKPNQKMRISLAQVLISKEGRYIADFLHETHKEGGRSLFLSQPKEFILQGFSA